MVTYNHDEWQDRTFEILVDGTRVGEQTIERRGPMRFFDVEYAVPAETVKGKQKVTVKFQATRGNEIGAVYGLRMIRAGRNGSMIVGQVPRPRIEVIQQSVRSSGVNGSSGVAPSAPTAVGAELEAARKTARAQRMTRIGVAPATAREATPGITLRDWRCRPP